MKRQDAVQLQTLIDAVLDSPGETDPGLRHAIEAYSSQLGGMPSAPAELIPAVVLHYVRKVAVHAYRTTDEDVTLRRGWKPRNL